MTVLHVGRYPGSNHVCNFGDDRLRGLGVARGRFSHFPIDLRSRPYNTLAVPCECVILEDTETFQVLFIVSLFCAWNITIVEINNGVHLLKR